MFDKENLISLAMFISFRIVLVHPLVDFICVVRWKILIVEKVFSSKSMNCLMSPSNFDAFWLKFCICFSQNFRFCIITIFIMKFLNFLQNSCIFFRKFFHYCFVKFSEFFFAKFSHFKAQFGEKGKNFKFLTSKLK